MNITILVGNLTRDPELRTTQTGKNVVNFTLAVERDYKNSEGNYPVDFIDVVAWNTLALSCATNLTKGRKVGVVGRTEIDTFVGNDGISRKKVYVNANIVDFSLSLRPKNITSAVQQTSQEQCVPPEQQTAASAPPPSQPVQSPVQAVPQQQPAPPQQPSPNNISPFPSQQLTQYPNAMPSSLQQAQQDYTPVNDVASMPY